MIWEDYPAIERSDFVLEEDYLAAVTYYCSLHIHQTLGPGLLESAYEGILEIELLRWDLDVKRQVNVDAVWRNQGVGLGYRADLLLNDKVIVELKSIKELKPVDYKQVLTYLRLENKRLGLLINFGGELLKGNFKRIVNGLPE